MALETPDTVIASLREIRAQSAKGYQALFEAESKFAELDRHAELTEAKAFLRAEGAVAERTAKARVEAADDRLEADIAKAEWNRVKAKIKLLEYQQMSVQTEARGLSSCSGADEPERWFPVDDWVRSSGWYSGRE